VPDVSIRGPFRGSDAVARGILRRGPLPPPRYRRIFPDIYLGATQDLDLLTLSQGAYLLVAPIGGILAGYSAAAMLGADCAPQEASAEVLVPRHVRAHPQLVVRQGRADGPDRWSVRGCAVTSPERTAWDLARGLPLEEAVVALDCLARRGRFAPAALLDRMISQPGARGCTHLRDIVELANPLAESAMETRLRLLLVRSGLPVPVVQHELVCDGRVVARFDLAYPRARLAIEYDGSMHDDRLDRRRDLRTGQLGWYTARFTASDLRRPATTVETVRRLFAVRMHRLEPNISALGT
jgi:very-short-patch-repair endonuclease